MGDGDNPAHSVIQSTTQSEKLARRGALAYNRVMTLRTFAIELSASIFRAFRRWNQVRAPIVDDFSAFIEWSSEADCRAFDHR